MRDKRDLLCIGVLNVEGYNLIVQVTEASRNTLLIPVVVQVTAVNTPPTFATADK